MLGKAVGSQSKFDISHVSDQGWVLNLKGFIVGVSDDFHDT